jgi:hypothetical protein
MCAGSVTLSDNGAFTTCDYCGTVSIFVQQVNSRAINKSNQLTNEQMKTLYAEAVSLMKTAQKTNSAKNFLYAQGKFAQIPGYKDVGEKARFCRDEAARLLVEAKKAEERILYERETDRMENIYKNACVLMRDANCENSFQNAKNLFMQISGYKDSDIQAKYCHDEAVWFANEQIKAEEQKAVERRQQKRLKTKRTLRKLTKAAFITFPIALILTVILILVDTNNPQNQDLHINYFITGALIPDFTIPELKKPDLSLELKPETEYIQTEIVKSTSKCIKAGERFYNVIISLFQSTPAGDGCFFHEFQSTLITHIQ